MESCLTLKRIVKILLLISLSIMLVVSFLLEISIILLLTEPEDKYVILRKTLAYVVCVSQAIIVLVELFGIVVVSIDYYRGCISLVVLEGIILFYAAYVAIIGQSALLIFQLVSHIFIIGLCIGYIREIKRDCHHHC